MRQIPLILLAALLFAGCSLVDPSPNAVVTNTAPAVRPTTGQGWYASLCNSCHNLNGSPVSSDVTDLRDYQDSLAHNPAVPSNVYRGSFATYSKALNEGPGAMPIYSDAELDTEARQLVYDYIKTLHR